MFIRGGSSNLRRGGRRMPFRDGGANAWLCQNYKKNYEIENILLLGGSALSASPKFVATKFDSISI